MGPSAFLGFQFKQHSLEAGVTIGLGKVKNVSLYQTDNADFWGTYDYKPLRIFVHYGYDIPVSSLVITPQLGVAITNISGAELRSSTSGNNIFEKAHALSATIGCRFGMNIGKSLRIHLTPEYDLAVKKSNGYNFLKDVDSKIKAWSSGINISAGLSFYL